MLINLLRPLDPSRWPSPASNESLAIRNQKFSDLVVKCLIKLTKVVYLDLFTDVSSVNLFISALNKNTFSLMCVVYLTSPA